MGGVELWVCGEKVRSFFYSVGSDRLCALFLYNIRIFVDSTLYNLFTRGCVVLLCSASLVHIVYDYFYLLNQVMALFERCRLMLALTAFSGGSALPLSFLSL